MTYPVQLGKISTRSKQLKQPSNQPRHQSSSKRFMQGTTKPASQPSNQLCIQAGCLRACFQVQRNTHLSDQAHHPLCKRLSDHAHHPLYKPIQLVDLIDLWTTAHTFHTQPCVWRSSRGATGMRLMGPIRTSQVSSPLPVH